MASCPQLDAARRARNGRLIAQFLFLIGFLIASPAVSAQDSVTEASRLAAAKAEFAQERWEPAAKLAEGPPEQSPDLDFLAGLALARLERWNDAKSWLEAGQRKSPHDPRFLVELGGIAYKQKQFKLAKRDLRAALRLAPRDEYAREFLATIYLLEGNLAAALKYWNSIDKPRLTTVAFDPMPKLQSRLLERAITFNAPQVLTNNAVASTQARLENLGVFSYDRVELATSGSGDYSATLHLSERNGWGDSNLEGIISLLSGLPYDTVYPEFYDLGHRAINFTSLARWDSQKRRYSGSLSWPLFHDPALRLRIYSDTRNENWNLSQTFFSAGTALSNLNMRRTAGGLDLRSVNGNWSWMTGLEFARRDFRNLDSSTTGLPVFANANSLAGWLAAERSLLRIPERRFNLDSSAELRIGRSFRDALGPFATGRVSVRAHWFPRAIGDDYEIQARVRAGGTVGKVPLDELFELGLERDNDLWMRGQAGTLDGRKGAAPLGRRYFLANWEIDKNIYRGAFFNLKLGPFLDSGTIADSSGLFGSRAWLWNTGAQCKVRILGSVSVVLIYGRNLRNNRNVFYGTVPR